MSAGQTHTLRPLLVGHVHFQSMKSSNSFSKHLMCDYLHLGSPLLITVGNNTEIHCSQKYALCGHFDRRAYVQLLYLFHVYILH